MKNKYFICTFLILILLDVACCESDFFLDKIPPVIIVKKLENEKSLFSYSIAGKPASGPGPNQESKLFIGRPSKGKGTPEGILECSLSLNSNPETNVTNHVVCNELAILPRILPSSVCQRDTSGSSRTQSRSELFSNLNFTGFTSSFGSTVAYENVQDRLITCDFKRREKSEQSPVRGLCYQSDGSGREQFSDVMFPVYQCRGNSGTRCDDLHYYALLGFSAHFTQSTGLVGMPGYLNYQGAVVRVGQHSSTTPCMMSQINLMDLKNYDYFGYSIASGMYFRNDIQRYAIGSPRGSMGKGKVFIVRLKMSGPAEFDRELHGDKFGSYFGSVLASLDLNADGLDDLLVGAPMYTITSYDEGCVFVYSRAVFSSRTQSFQTSAAAERWCPSDIPGGRFGSSIAPLGDINEDGFGDVAISAPYADKGRVYIYFGGAAGTLREYAVIDPSPTTDINGFGTTIVGNADLDGNGTPDLAVGSFLSKSIAVYLTRARIVLSINFVADSGYQQLTKFKREDKTFVLSPLICARLKSVGKLKSLPDRLGVWVKVVADSQISPKRFLIDPPVGNVGLRSVEIPITLRKTQSGLCGNHNISVSVENLKDDDQKGIAFDWQVWYNETSPAFNSTDIIDVDTKRAAKRSDRGTSFCSACPAPSGPFRFNYEVQLEDNCNDDFNPVCSPKLVVTAQFQDNEGKELGEITIGKTPLVNVKIVLKNIKETAYYPRVIVRLTPENIDLTDVLTLNAPKCLKKFSDSATVDLSCQDIVMHKNSPEETFTGTLNFKNLRAKTKSAKIVLRVDAFPEGVPINNGSQEKTLVIKSDVKLEIMPIASKKTPLSDREITEFVHQFRVQNTKASPPENVQLIFKFPRFYENEKEPVITFVSANSPTVECSPDNEKSQSTLNSQVNELRRRRNVEVSKSSEETKVATGTQLPGSSVSLSCEDKKWKCVQLDCTGKFSDNNYKEFDIQLNYKINSTLARKLKIIKDDLMELTVTTSALLHPFYINGEKISVTASQTFTITSSSVGPTAIELICAGIIGLILLFLIIVGLFKCGFFRRKTKEELEALKAQTEEEENLARNFPVHTEQSEEDE